MDNIEDINNKKKKDKNNKDMADDELMLWCFIMGSQQVFRLPARD